MTDTRIAHRICPLCEACCGLEIELDATDKVVVASAATRPTCSAPAIICPKGVALKDLHDDPDRLRAPLVKRDGRFVEASWDEAFAEIERRLPPILAQHGRDAVALVLGNPSAHKIGPAALRARASRRALGTTQHVLGVDARPDAQAAVGRADVRPLAVDPGARHRAHATSC